VNHIYNIPIILLGEMWSDFTVWIKSWLLEKKLTDEADFKLLFLAKNNQEALAIIKEAYQSFKIDDKYFCFNYIKYKV
jgi:predicted Rossmann-fold nucleotide-binding protein